MEITEEYKSTYEYQKAAFWAIGMVVSTVAVLLCGLSVLAMGMVAYGPVQYALTMTKASCLVWIIAFAMCVRWVLRLIDEHPEILGK